MAGWRDRLSATFGAGRHEHPREEADTPTDADAVRAMADATAAERVNMVLDAAPAHGYGNERVETAPGRALLALPLDAQRDALLWALEEEVRLQRARGYRHHHLDAHRPAQRRRSNVRAVARRLMRRKLGFDEATLARVVKLGCTTFGESRSVTAPEGGYTTGLITQAQGTLAGRPASGVLLGALEHMAGGLDQERGSVAGARAHRKLLEVIAGEEGSPTGFEARDPWGVALTGALLRLDEPARTAGRSLLDLAARTSSSSKPPKVFAGARAAIVDPDPAGATRALTELLLCAARVPVSADRGPVPPDTGNVLRALVWAADGLPGADLAFALGSLAVTAWRKVPGHGPLAKKVATAAVAALGSSADGGAQLGRVHVQVKQPAARQGVDAAIGQAAARAGIPVSEFAERTVPDFDLIDGFRQDVIDDLSSMATIAIDDRGKVRLGWLSATGKPVKSVPAEVRKEAAQRLAALRLEVKDLQTMLDAQKLRLERLLLDDPAWTPDAWRERYADHGLVGPLARRLLWRADDETIAFHDGDWEALGGDPVDLAVVAEIRLWHPVAALAPEVHAWREQLEAWRVQQPFKQAHREVYLLTDAERRTDVYSNRFAAHVLRQHQMAALARARGWDYALQGAWDSADEHVVLDLPRHGLRAVFFVERPHGSEDWNDTGVYTFVLTDQVRFETSDSSVGDPQVVHLEQIPPRVLSEVLRDVDLLVGVASIGNDPEWADRGTGRGYDRYWQSYSFGELGASAEVRRDVLSRLLPKLALAEAATLDGRFLRVQGARRAYKIHLGSGNILMEPNDQYLCIVPGGEGPDDVMLPFAGDRGLALILSKALLLADDGHITDATILSQIDS